MSCSVCQGYDSDRCPCCSEGVREIECPDCNGTGINPWRAVNIETFEIVEVTKDIWIALPEDEYEAQETRHILCRYEEGGDKCLTCHGDGKIPEDY